MAAVRSHSFVAWAVVVAFASGCEAASSEQAGYSEVVLACGPVINSPPAALVAGVFSDPVSTNCGAELGGALNVDWETFGGAPAEFYEPSTASELLVAGVIILLAADGGPGDPCAAPAAPENFRASLGGCGELEGENGKSWFDLMQRTISEVRHDLAIPYPMARASDALVVGDIASDDPPEGVIGAPPMAVVEVAALLAHEVSHAVYGRHVACADEQERTECDETAEGAYGVGAWWAARWALVNAAVLDFDDCDAARYSSAQQCSAINESDDFASCEADILRCSGT
ncbi:hypothetical protein LBMAG42_48240 [Deltaproteobacteria bacterium]|nr:hypothetical protein LBMAG42_48240 [Deltaproteobacteria bacterium]